MALFRVLVKVGARQNHRTKNDGAQNDKSPSDRLLARAESIAPAGLRPAGQESSPGGSWWCVQMNADIERKDVTIPLTREGALIYGRLFCVTRPGTPRAASQ